MKKILLIFLCLSFSFLGCSQNDESGTDSGWDTGGSVESKLTVMSYNIRHCADRKSTRLNSSHASKSRMPSSA